jgi:hypothetical protein
MEHAMTTDPDHNPPLSQVLVKGPTHLIKSIGEPVVEPTITSHTIEPKPAITPRPTAKQIAYDPDGVANRSIFGGGILR